MRLSANLVVSTLLEEHPATEEVLWVWGIDVDPLTRRQTVAAVCTDYGIEVEDLLADLQSDLDAAEANKDDDLDQLDDEAKDA